MRLLAFIIVGFLSETIGAESAEKRFRERKVRFKVDYDSPYNSHFFVGMGGIQKSARLQKGGSFTFVETNGQTFLKSQVNEVKSTQKKNYNGFSADFGFKCYGSKPHFTYYRVFYNFLPVAAAFTQSYDKPSSTPDSFEIVDEHSVGAVLGFGYTHQEGVSIAGGVKGVYKLGKLKYVNGQAKSLLKRIKSAAFGPTVEVTYDLTGQLQATLEYSYLFDTARKVKLKDKGLVTLDTTQGYHHYTVNPKLNGQAITLGLRYKVI